MTTTFEDYGIQVSGHGEKDTTCPKCSPSRKKKTDPCLSVSVDQGTWYCHHCGWSGGLKDGVRSDFKPANREEFKKPDFEFKVDLPEKIYSFLVEERKIATTVLHRNRVCFQNNAICFPFYKSGECVNVKHRGMDKRFWQTSGAEKTLYGYDDIDNETTIITEGEFDKLALEVAGFKNAVSVPDGAPSPEAKTYASKFSFLDNCKDRLDQVKSFILAVDGDPPGKKLEEELARRLGLERCSRVEWPDGCKDANEVLVKLGPDKLKEVIGNPIPYPVENIAWVADQDLENFYESGLTPGLYPGWPSIERHYTIAADTGELHILTGIPGHGKSEWLDALMINLAESEGWNFGVFSPENYPLEYHLSKLTEKFTGKPFREGFKTRINREELTDAKAWLDDHFSFIVPDEDHLTVDSILALAKVLVYRRGIRGLVIDPWNELDHNRPDRMTETEYISQSLTKIRRFARHNSCHVWLVVHPTKLPKNLDGKFPVPTPYDISGSAHWRNKADNCLSVWRDTDPSKNSFEVEIHVQKVRKKHIGNLGMARLHYEYSTGRYSEISQQPR